MSSSLLKPILTNRAEELADKALENIVQKGDRLVPKASLSEVVDVDSPTLRGVAPKGYMLQATFDFVIVRDSLALFVVEIDGLQHERDPDTLRRDSQKDAVCEAARLPYLRIRSSLMNRTHGRKAILEYIADSYYLYEAFYAAQCSGVIPWDEPFVRRNIRSLNYSTGDTEEGLDVEAIRYLGRAMSDGVIPTNAPDSITLRVPHSRTVRCISYLSVAHERYLLSDLSVRDFRFVGIMPGDLAEGLSAIEIADLVHRWSNRDGVAVNRATLEKSFLGVQSQIDRREYIMLSYNSENAQVAGWIPPLTIRNRPITPPF